MINMPVAIVTGASGCIGRATCLELAKRGFHIVIQYNQNKHSAEELEKEILKLGGEAILAKVDFSNPPIAEEEIDKMVKAAVKKFGQIDALVNLAGYPITEFGMWEKKGKDYSIQDIQKILNVDTLGSFLCIKKVVPIMIKQKKGSIINTSSNASLVGYENGFGFHVAKSANLALTKCFAHELSPFVRVNTIAPGNIGTGWLKKISKKEYEQLGEESLLKRIGKPEEVAKVIAFLASDDSSFVNGQTIVIDGGVVMY